MKFYKRNKKERKKLNWQHKQINRQLEMTLLQKITDLVTKLKVMKIKMRGFHSTDLDQVILKLCQLKNIIFKDKYSRNPIFYKILMMRRVKSIYVKTTMQNIKMILFNH